MLPVVASYKLLVMTKVPEKSHNFMHISNIKKMMVPIIFVTILKSSVNRHTYSIAVSLTVQCTVASD